MNINAMEVLSAKDRIIKLLWANFYLYTLDVFYRPEREFVCFKMLKFIFICRHS